MERTVSIGGVKCRLKTSAALPRLYRQLLRRDVFADMSAILALFAQPEKDAGEDEKLKLKIDIAQATEEQLRGLDMIEELTWIMAKHADPLQPDTVEEWLAQFDDAGGVFDALGTVLEMWFAENKQTSTEQKKTGR